MTMTTMMMTGMFAELKRDDEAERSFRRSSQFFCKSGIITMLRYTT